MRATSTGYAKDRDPEIARRAVAIPFAVMPTEREHESSESVSSGFDWHPEPSLLRFTSADEARGPLEELGRVRRALVEARWCLPVMEALGTETVLCLLGFERAGDS